MSTPQSAAAAAAAKYPVVPYPDGAVREFKKDAVIPTLADLKEASQALAAAARALGLRMALHGGFAVYALGFKREPQTPDVDCVCVGPPDAFRRQILGVAKAPRRFFIDGSNFKFYYEANSGNLVLIDVMQEKTLYLPSPTDPSPAHVGTANCHDWDGVPVLNVAHLIVAKLYACKSRKPDSEGRAKKDNDEKDLGYLLDLVKNKAEEGISLKGTMADQGQGGELVVAREILSAAKSFAQGQANKDYTGPLKSMGFDM